MLGLNHLSQTDWLVLGVGAALLWGLLHLSRQVEDLRQRLAPDEDDDYREDDDEPT